MKTPDIKLSKRLNKLFFQNQEGGVFVECGANNGYAGSITWWFENKKSWSGVLIEPNPRCFFGLTQNRPNCVNLNLALSNTRGHSTFKVPTDGSRGPFTGRGSLELSFDSRPTEIYEVSTDTYKNVLGDLEKIDLFVLDVEGHEMEVLDGALGGNLLPRVWIIETDKIAAEAILDIIGPLGYKIAGEDKSNTYFLREV